jgi:tetratricopeptide (TPR) repeat protein
VARAAAQKGRKREKADAGRRSGGRRRRSTPVAEQTLFFNRLRGQAKWMFVFLALVFGVGFVVFGVGGGIPGTSLGDILRSNGSSNSASESDLRNRIKEHPKDAAAYRDLATQLQQDGKTQEAIDTLGDLARLQPKNTTVLAQLGSLYLLQANRYGNQAQQAQIDFAEVNPGAFMPELTANGQPVFTDPVTSPAAQEASTHFNQAASNAQGAYSNAVDVYKRLAKLTPRDAQAQLQLAQTAQTSGDYKTAITAYQKVLKLSPNDPQAPAIRQQIKASQAQLRKALRDQAAQQAAAAQSSSSG